MPEYEITTESGAKYIVTTEGPAKGKKDTSSPASMAFEGAKGLAWDTLTGFGSLAKKVAIDDPLKYSAAQAEASKRGDTMGILKNAVLGSIPGLGAARYRGLRRPTRRPLPIRSDSAHWWASLWVGLWVIPSRALRTLHLGYTTIRRGWFEESPAAIMSYFRAAWTPPNGAIM